RPPLACLVSLDCRAFGCSAPSVWTWPWGAAATPAGRAATAWVTAASSADSAWTRVPAATTASAPAAARVRREIRMGAHSLQLFFDYRAKRTPSRRGCQTVARLAAMRLPGLILLLLAAASPALAESADASVTVLADASA